MIWDFKDCSWYALRALKNLLCKLSNLGKGGGPVGSGGPRITVSTHDNFIYQSATWKIACCRKWTARSGVIALSLTNDETFRQILFVFLGKWPLEENEQLLSDIL